MSLPVLAASPAARLLRFLPVLVLGFALAPEAAQAAWASRARSGLDYDSGMSAGIVAVVNGDVISKQDVDNRRRLFALSAGLPVTPEILDRLTPQVVNQLVDEKLRLQEVQRRKIVVGDREIAAALAEVEKQNHMPPGALRAKLAADGVEMRTLIDQIRVQLGWGRVLRQQLGENAGITPADIAAEERLLKAQLGQPEYRVSEIFIPVEEPSHEAEARRFAETVIQQLRGGAQFPVVAAQFSQSQTALEGGDLGWVQPSQVDPEVARVIKEMPEGAISNPIRVAGGYSIVALRAKRQIGNDPATLLSIERVLFPFTATLDPMHPTEQQRRQLARAKHVAAAAHGCDELKTLASSGGGDVKVLPLSDLRLEALAQPQLRKLLAGLPDGKSTMPLVSQDGIGLIMVCSRQQKNLGALDKEQIARQLLTERIELASRQMLRNLRRKAVIEIRKGAA
jgi:peptidyl-prolyl cis-trans isomerase SurA